jgi:hypothetical protein
MYCHHCGVEAPLRQVTLYQNIGALVVRYTQTLTGELCKSCIATNFWKMTLTTFFLGWWGTISFFMTPFILINNLVRYIMSLGMEGVPMGRMAPQLSEDVLLKLQPVTDELIERLNKGEALDTVTRDIAYKAGTTGGHVYLYVKALVAAANKK